MPETFSGRCHCGAFSYESDSELIAPHYCHCGDCRRLYGALGAGFVVLEAQTRIRGEYRSYTSQADSGNRKTHLFCGQCGSPIGERVDAFPGTLVLVPGTLDDPSLFKPEAHFWTSKKAPWQVIADGLEQLEGQPVT
ncbi:MAG TPA: GFA family protein [Spongiibacteraceae bacterium]|nr:aldehyde-activating protein [Spongiibacteraceae bacterium]HCS28123.1 GFA family protein [Spongiibacteraceae bacterium]